jgi:hypothetical protein
VILLETKAPKIQDKKNPNKQTPRASNSRKKGGGKEKEKKKNNKK